MKSWSWTRKYVILSLLSDLLDKRISLSMRTFVRSHYQDLSWEMNFDLVSVLPLTSLVMLLFLHRAFFAQALVENHMDLVDLVLLRLLRPTVLCLSFKILKISSWRSPVSSFLCNTISTLNRSLLGLWRWKEDLVWISTCYRAIKGSMYSF